MKRLVLYVMIMILCLAVSISVYASASTEEAEAMVKKAVAFMKENGKEKALAEFNKPKSPFVKGELYIFVYDMNATIVAHPIKPALIGKNLLEMTDYSGKYFRKEIVRIAKEKGKGWVDYDYQNPVSKKIELKTTYFEKVGDLIICCGAYK